MFNRKEKPNYTEAFALIFEKFAFIDKKCKVLEEYIDVQAQLLSELGLHIVDNETYNRYYRELDVGKNYNYVEGICGTSYWYKVEKKK